MAVPCAPTGDKQVQLRRGTTAQNDAFTGADGELSFDTDENRLRVHDGVTAGGFRLGFKSEIDLKLNLTGGTLTGDLEIGAIHLDTDGSAIFGALATQVSIATTGVISFPDNVRQIFNPGVDNAGLNVGALAGDPSTPINGDLWYDSTANELTARINGVNVALGAGSAPPFSDSTALVMGSVTPSKLLRFEVDGFTAATTRVLTPQNASYTIAGTDIAQTFTQLQTFDDSLGINIGAVMNISDPGSAGAMQISGGSVDVIGSLLAFDFNVNLGSHQLFSDGSALFASGALAFSTAGLITFPDGVRQTFNPNGTTPGLNVGSFAGDPSTPINGDLWYDSTANELTARINGANVALGTGGYTLTFGTLATLIPADSTTYYFTFTGDPAATSTTYNNVKIAIPKTGILRRFDMLVRIGGTLGSGETVSHFVRINDTTDVGQIDCAYNVAAQNVSSTINQAVTVGDFVAIKLVAPAWVTNPTTIRHVVTLYIE